MPNRILIVDDEPLNLDLLDQELAEMGHVTERAIDGSEALAKLDTINPDLVLLDYQMPGMNGIGVLRESAGVTKIYPWSSSPPTARLNEPSKP
jgi:CheY-like chemotaxis protein